MHCGVDMHVCKNCQLYDPAIHNQCREPEAQFIRDREVGNFCPHFDFRKADAAPKQADNVTADVTGPTAVYLDLVLGSHTFAGGVNGDELDLTLIDTYDEHIGAVELYLTRTAKVDDAQAYARLRSVPGIGQVLGLVLLYEIHDIHRFAAEGQFLSYARLVRCVHKSAGKTLGHGGKKIGNAHLKWAFSEAACLMLRSCVPVKAWMQRQEKKRGKRKALSVLEAKIGRTVYHLWRKQQAFDVKKFLHS
jgi:transposase